MKVELLSPAGSPEKLRYALAYGADAVYAGIPRFSLRARQNGFRDESLRQAIAYAHGLGKKIYITANILPPNRKIGSFQKSLATYAEAGADAFIMSDPGLIRFALREFPQVPVHLSVQTNTMNWMTVAFWHDLGVRRTILSRELSLEEIREIHEKVPGMELEAFVHGSICIAYSGRCLLSNYFNHRDANQGTCTNSCRWDYNIYKAEDAAPHPPAGSLLPAEGEFYIEETSRPGQLMPIDEDEHGTYIMNSRDLRAMEWLTDLRGAGVLSFKIEGRSKSVYYLSRVTRAYRRAMDDLAAGRPLDPSNLEETDKTANRGFTSAFLVSSANRATERFDSPQEDRLPQTFAGQVVGQRSGGWMEVEIKNQVRAGDTLEYLSPARQHRFILEEMENARGVPLDIAHGGNGTVWIRMEGEETGTFALLSRVEASHPAVASRPM
ncbi:MAG: U32 family peptidase [Nitrospinae bacterium CG11_big_fil_rev_8_21_14_0_20_56_8]|nr:MAG: U32 family peptidase [Nitrospinae bacterium CG11_big_fil_rev_8_21_14_0_20_56_8]